MTGNGKNYLILENFQHFAKKIAINLFIAYIQDLQVKGKRPALQEKILYSKQEILFIRVSFLPSWIWI
jgi:hypothetical protein